MTIETFGDAGLGARQSSPDAAYGGLAALRRPTELLLLTGLICFYVLAFALDIKEFYWTLNVAGPVALIGTLGWSCYRIVKSAPVALWAPLFWFRLACAAYFGLGALAPHISNEETRSHIYTLSNFDDALNLKVNLICAAGILCTLALSYIFLSWDVRARRHMSPGEETSSEAHRTLFFAFCFLIVGGGLRYGMIVPYTLGLTDTVLPGMFGSLAKSYYAGIYLLIVYAVKHNRSHLMFALALVAAEIAVSIASFAKSELMLILIFTFLGFITARPRKVTLLVGSCAIIFTYISFQPVVTYGREQILLRYGQISGAGIEERLDIVANWLDHGREETTEKRQGWFARLSYVNVNAFVVNQYDSGAPGNTFRDAAAVFVPRVFWPNKPIITELGEDLNYLVFRRFGSQLGVGHFAEAYWNFGWAGFFPFMAVLALILSLFTRMSLTIMARRDWLLLPIVFLGINMGLRVDGHFVPDILGAAWSAFLLQLALVTIRAMLKTGARAKLGEAKYVPKLR